jgi:hypothetical protein
MFVVLVVVVAVAVIGGATSIGARTAKEAAYGSAVHDQSVSGLTASMIVEFGHQFCRNAKQGGFKTAIRAAQNFANNFVNGSNSTKAEQRDFFKAVAIMSFYAVDYFCPQFKDARKAYSKS